ncbi:MAG: hypothetical protein D6678_01685 [Zetaproteobacteria bacterium]|nr:MAG: hypothetical protein D6678_01685 [Zetaproteobacteria bacterium]
MAGNVKQRAADQRALNTFALWTAWAISSIAVFLMMYRDANVWAFVKHDQTRVSWIILGMFILGVLVSLAQAMKLTGEWFRAYRIESMMQSKGLSAVNPRKGRHIVDRFMGALRRIVDEGGKLDIEALVDVEFSAQHRLSQFVGLLGNLMITLGLIGTVLGMTITMNGLHGALGEIGFNQDLLIDGLRSAMDGMGVAFYTTLMGSVMGGVLLRVFSWITDASINGLQDLMLRTCIVHASADLEPSAARDVRNLEASVDHLQQKIELLNMAMQVSRENMAQLREETGRMHQSLSALLEDDPMRKLARSHARYARDVRPGFFARLFRRG